MGHLFCVARCSQKGKGHMTIKPLVENSTSCNGRDDRFVGSFLPDFSTMNSTAATRAHNSVGNSVIYASTPIKGGMISAVFCNS